MATTGTAIPDLPPAAPLVGDEMIPLEQTITKRTDPNSIAALAGTVGLSSALIDNKALTASTGGQLYIEHCSGTTPYLDLPATGMAYYERDQTGTRRLRAQFVGNYNQSSLSQGIPNGSNASGDDGWWYVLGNKFDFISTQNLVGGRSDWTATVSGGSITALSSPTGTVTGYAAGEVVTIFTYDPTGLGSGLAATVTANGSGSIAAATPVITNGGSGYVSGAFSAQGLGPATAHVADVGPEFNFGRLVYCDNGSQLASFRFMGASSRNSGLDTVYASFVTEIVDKTFGVQRGRFGICTGGPFAISGGQNIRFWFGWGQYANGLSDLGVGTISARDTVSITSEDAGTAPKLIVNKKAATSVDAVIGELQIAGYNGAGTTFFAGRIQAVMRDATAGSEDTRLDFRRTIAGTSSVGMFLGAGLFMNASGVSDPGAGNVAANGILSKEGFFLGSDFTGVFWAKGAGSPEGQIAAPPGSLYSRTDGGAGTCFYVKESGSGATGWIAK